MGYAPENTLLSFKTALTCGIPALELDIHSSKDQNWVVIHDDTLDRTTDHKGRVRDFSSSELRKIWAGADQTLPLLVDVLDALKGTCILNIEIKSDGLFTGLAKLLTQAVETKEWSWDQFIISSFNHHWLKTLSQICPQVRIGALTASLHLDYAAFAEKLGSWSIHVSRECIDKTLIDDAHARGLKIFVYTVNQTEEMQELTKMGIDGFFTNYPDRGLAAIQGVQKPPAP